MEAQFLGQPQGETRLGDFLEQNLTNAKWTAFRAAIAFVKQAGVKHVETTLGEFVKRADVKISVGISFGGTSVEGLTRLHEAVGTDGEIWIFHNGNGSTFHPKVYLFKNDDEAHVAIGSGNMTGGGLYTNYEAGFVLTLNLSNEADAEMLRQVEASLNAWIDPAPGTAKKLDDALLTELTIRGYLPPEVYSRETEEAGAGSGEEGETPLFAAVNVKGAPQRSMQQTAISGANVAANAAGPTVFYITLQYVDMSRGQLTPEAQERSPEIYIPLIARDAAPEFWGWPGMFNEDPAKPGKFDRFHVKMLIGLSIEDVTMVYFPHRHEFRLRSKALQNSGGQGGDILKIERTDGSAGYLYQVTIVLQGSREYPAARAICVNTVKKSPKEWGYV